ncbi:MAG: tRNA dihydrouridine synthase DusB [Oscillospiraceae bacterium]|nr:tRNA dihydrouridine synthase DusB [Oscillospiraceae bacterium]
MKENSVKNAVFGNLSIPQTSGLSPMASVADRAYRLIAKKFGAVYLVGEMVSAQGLCYSSERSGQLLKVTDEERPMAVQLFGSDPSIMAKAAKIAAQYRPDIIDINMGCPMPKVTGNGSGGALMRTPELAANIVHSVTDAVNVPVTVKIRKGWDDDTVNAVEFAKLMEKSGCAAICVHGRTVKQIYSGRSDSSIIAEVKAAVNIPVIGNGDINSGESAMLMYKQTGCDFIMVGRASQGAPWIFREIDSYLRTGKPAPPPPPDEVIEIMLEHISLACSVYGEKRGIIESRKHAAWYLKGFHNAAQLRASCVKIENYQDLKRLASQAKKLIIDLLGN